MLNSGIYKIINKVDGKFYIGSSKDILKRWDKHLKDLRKHKHHSIKLQEAYDTYGEESFTYEIVEEIQCIDKSHRKKLYEREQFWIDSLNAKENGYNIADSKFGDMLTHHPKREQIIEKITNTINSEISQMTIEERKEKWGRNGELNGMYGRHRTEDEKKHLSEIHKGKKITYVKPRTKESIEKWKKSIIENGTTFKGENNPFYGKHHNDETKKKISESNKGRKPVNRRKVTADGITYDSVYDCAKYNGVCTGTVIFRIKSIYWNWFYAD